MANNFKNAFKSIVTAGENYQSTGSATDNHTGPQLIYTANNGSSGVNSILIELDASNTGTASVSVTAFVQDTSSTLGSISSISSSSDIATVTTASPRICSKWNNIHLCTKLWCIKRKCSWDNRNIQSISYCKRCSITNCINIKNSIWSENSFKCK